MINSICYDKLPCNALDFDGSSIRQKNAHEVILCCQKPQRFTGERHGHEVLVHSSYANEKGDATRFGERRRNASAGNSFNFFKILHLKC